MMKSLRSALLGFVALSTLSVPFCAAQTTRPSANAPATTHPAKAHYESTIEKFEELDRTQGIVPGQTLFVGSSTFTRWPDIPQVFAEFHATNRAFGGSVTSEQLMYMDRIVLPRKPANIVYYCGDNDIAAKRAPQVVVDNFRTFVDRVHQALPNTRLYYVSIKVCPSRVKLADQVRKANELVHQYIEQNPELLRYIDINAVICDAQGQPKPDIYISDKLHFNAAGYQLVTPLIKEALEKDVKR